MSMFRRRVPPDGGHEQHDVLLVAQYAARDPLQPEQVRQAAALVGSCQECASLAADLGAISRAVATEPVPGRRRDFTLSVEQARQLRGTPIQRFMRRLAVPESGALRPLAAGLMSLGLVLVVAGNVIPIAQSEVATTVPASDASVEVVVGDEAAQRENDSAPVPLPSDAARSENESDIGSDGASGLVGGSESSDVGASAGNEPLEEPAAADAVDLLERDAAEFREDASGEMASEMASEAVAPDQLGASAPEALDPPAGFADAAPSPRRADDSAKRASSRKATLDDEVAPGMADADARVGIVEEAPVMAEEAPVAEDPAVESQAEALVPASREREDLAQEVAVTAAEPVQLDDLLVVVGVVLALGGFLFLLLIWFARRRNPDPLAS